MNPTQLPEAAYQFLLAHLRAEVAEAPTREARDAMRKAGRLVLRSCKIACPHLHTCQI